MNLVVGATGLVGSEICRLLAERKQPVRALVRDPSSSKSQSLHKTGIEIVSGDVKNRETLDAACAGVTTVLSTVSSTLSRKEGDTIDSVDLKGQLNLIDAAYSGEVRNFIYLSFSGNFKIEFPLRTAKRTVEDYLKGSGLAYTILRPSYFMEVWLGPHLGFDFNNARVQIYGTGRNKISWISYRDVARFAVNMLDNPKARNQVIELGGPDMLSPLEVVQVFEEVSGRKFEVIHLSEEALRTKKAEARDPLEESLAGLMLSVADGDPIDMKETLKQYPLQMKSVREYAKQALGK